MPRESWPNRWRAYERALQVKPDNPQVRMSRALCWLQMGDFERGWAEYEWRLKCKEFSIPAFRQPLWDGSPLEGRSILLYADHGLGDSIQFIRYAPLVKARGGRVIVACQQPLARLLATCPGIDQVVAEGSLLPEFAFYAPLMSLPRILGTSLASIPAEVPYLTADTALGGTLARRAGARRRIQNRHCLAGQSAIPAGSPAFLPARSTRAAGPGRRCAALQSPKGRWNRPDRRARRALCRVRPRQPVLPTSWIPRP